jgi:Concanavalin A-like lectin/glucanases superfamily/Domain of unknown function (DUF2341)
MRNLAQGNVLRSTAFAAGYLLSLGNPLAAEDLTAWAHATDIVLNTSASGANVAGTVTNFPVLVRLNAANFTFPQAKGKGQDIRFATAGGAPLAYEIERWDSARGRAEIWVRIDTVRGNAADQTYRMFWGNPAAPDSSHAGSVFRASDNFTAAWHLNGSGTAARPNAVTGGNPAVPVAYDGDENREGMIAGADSLDGAAAGDYLDLGDGYTQFGGGFTFSAWVDPTAIRRWCHVLDLGNGEASDNIVVNRVDTTGMLGFYEWTGTTGHYRSTTSAWVLNKWQYITVTLAAKNLRIYKDGVQILADTLTDPLTGVTRTANFLGRSSWAADQFFQGMIDEPELSKTARSADWIKLAYQNQRPGQTLLVVKPADCAARFSVPADTALSEGDVLSLSATVECAESYAWSVVAGPSARILDPEAKPLVLRIPRVSGDTAVVYRLTAEFSDSTASRDVRIVIQEAIPDPVFTLPAVAAWNGKDSLAYRPAIANLAAIKASRDSTLSWNWTLSGPGVDTTLLTDGILLRQADAEGELHIELCLDNGSTPVCHSAILNVSASTPLRNPGLTHRSPSGAVFPGWDAAGRAASPLGARAHRLPRFQMR